MQAIYHSFSTAEVPSSFHSSRHPFINTSLASFLFTSSIKAFKSFLCLHHQSTVHLFVQQFILSSIHPRIHTSTNRSIYLSIYPSIHPSIYPSIYPCMYRQPSITYSRGAQPFWVKGRSVLFLMHSRAGDKITGLTFKSLV